MIVFNMKKLQTYIFVFVVTISIFSYLYIGYWIDRSEFIHLLLLDTILFLCFFYFFKYFQKRFHFLHILGLGIFFRVLFLYSSPELSNDFYRFLWDGHLMRIGVNPFLHTPSQIIDKITFPLADSLYEGMGSLSQSNYTCYPPLHQFIFLLSAWVSPFSITGSLIFLHVIMILAAIGNTILIYKLLKQWNIARSNLVLFVLNPFVIIELTGNLHFEGIMIFFIVYSLYLLVKNRYFLAAVMFGLAISIKLIPLILIPLLIHKLKIKKGMVFSVLSGLTFIILFFPFFSNEMVNHFFASLELYFQSFEFNASLYYIIRSIGYTITGYNIIRTAGVVLAALSFLTILLIAFKSDTSRWKQTVQAMMFTMIVFYIFSTTVHPWYIAPIVVLSVFTSYRFVIVWSFLIILSYIAYSNTEFKENLWLLGIEYVTVLITFFVEYKNRLKRVC